MATGDQHTRKNGADHGDSDDIPVADVSDALTTTTLDDEIVNGEWEDWDENCEDTAFVCLFCPETFRSRSETLQHCLSHGFNYNNIKKEWGMFASLIALLSFSCSFHPSSCTFPCTYTHTRNHSLTTHHTPVHTPTLTFAPSHANTPTHHSHSPQHVLDFLLFIQI